ncbi:MAG: SDR family NAD(P)-dependent oxidoreductase [Syntrophales bacterium]|jgi:NAD(P)-dependent dehydrogenase (short-subunit alcohol dehydrogenase family)
MKLKNQIALVTGGGTGLGKAVVEMLVREGAKVAINGVDFIKTDVNQYDTKNIGGYTAAKNFSEGLNKKGFETIAVEADVTDSAQVNEMVSHVIKTFGRLDILVNAAGIIFTKYVAETADEEWDNMINTNLTGTFHVNRAVIEQMQEQQYGRIVNFSSMMGKNTDIAVSAYCASKWGVLGFTGCLAKELAHDNITVNAVCPGIIDTQMWTLLATNLSILGAGETPEEAFNNYCAEHIPQGVPQTSEDIAEGILYLITAPHVTGVALSIDGGHTM